MTDDPKYTVPNRGTGRPTKFTPELQQTIVKYIQAGAYVETAAKAAGVDKSTFYDWLKRGAQGEEPYVGFSYAVEKALGQAEMRDVLVIDAAGQNGTWQAAAWRLERKFHDRWGRKDHLDVAANVNVSGADAREKLEGIITGIASRGGADEVLPESDT